MGIGQKRECVERTYDQGSDTKIHLELEMRRREVKEESIEEVIWRMEKATGVHNNLMSD